MLQPVWCQAQEALKALPPLIDIGIEDDAHITVCGDIHGQYYDLLNIFDMNGLPSLSNPYVFNGELATCSGHVQPKACRAPKRHP